MHTPTVRMKELAADPDGARYATALHRLFDLDPEAVAALTAADESSPVGLPADVTASDPSYDDLLGGLS